VYERIMIGGCLLWMAVLAVALSRPGSAATRLAAMASSGWEDAEAEAFQGGELEGVGEEQPALRPDGQQAGGRLGGDEADVSVKPATGATCQR
jgi:hypothetical protein